jgi:PTH1 family peptidyl-tRNA hydrolase
VIRGVLYPRIQFRTSFRKKAFDFGTFKDMFKKKNQKCGRIFPMYTIVGLGNVGEEYAETRHNVGWIVLEHIIEKNGLPSLSKSASFSGLLSEGTLHSERVGILFPTTFMNNSGGPVSKYVKEKGSLEKCIVVHDEIDLPFGEVRIAYDRGAGGHNGVKSIVDSFGSNAFIRIRVGIAQKGFFGGIKRPKGEKLSDYVLGKFKSGEAKQLPEIAHIVDEALKLIITKGHLAAMQVVNGR